ncbi:MAG TPA: response regulator transcription factor [Patescibacteria group bacterium]|nr:response regulator transcription factor [Patescibacteria group bacterium]
MDKKSGKKLKILVVEDEEILLTALSEELRQEGFEVVGAKDGVEGLEKAAAEQPDLMLLDLVMPRLDGISTLKQMKAQENTKEIPVVILTNLSDYDKISDALSMGAMDYLVKANYRLEELVTKIKTVLERRKAGEGGFKVPMPPLS